MPGRDLNRMPPPIEECTGWLARPLRDSIAYIIKNARKGVKCPCCFQIVKLRQRKFNAGMAATLVAMWAETLRRERQGNRDPWIHVEHQLVEKGLAPKRCRDFSQMRYLGLIESKARMTRTTGPDANDTGFYKVTTLGRHVCENPRRPLIRKYMLTFDNGVHGFEGPEISLKQALGDRFDFQELVCGEKIAA